MRVRNIRGNNPLRHEDRKRKLKYAIHHPGNPRSLSTGKLRNHRLIFSNWAYIEVSHKIRKMHENSIVARVPEIGSYRLTAATS